MANELRKLATVKPTIVKEVEDGYERKVGNFLRAYLDYTKESESPDNYHIWTALSAISSVTRRKVWLDQGLYILYPNLYVALVGPPARTAKSTAIRMGRRLIQGIPGVTIGPDSCSREELIREMAGSKLDNQCAMTVHSSEFSSIIDVSGIMMIQFLTDIYDCDFRDPKGWRYSTKTQGKDEVVNPYLTMLVGTTPSYIADALPNNVIGHGFTSRMIFVHEDTERLINPRPGAEDTEMAQRLIADLRHISFLSGQFKWTDDGMKAYDEFYRNLYVSIPPDYRMEGYHWRKKIHVLKVAMLLSLAESDDLLLSKRDIDSAIGLLTAIEPNMARTFSAVGKYEYASDLERIGSQINSTPTGCPVSEVFKRNYFIGGHDEIRRILSTLHQMGAISLGVKGNQEWVSPSTTPGSMPWVKGVK
jgi:hypothetical protein